MPVSETGNRIRHPEFKIGGQTLEKQTHFDFITSVCLMGLSLAVIFDSFQMAKDVGGFLYASPGMMPMVLAILLLFTSILLMKRSIQANGVNKNISDFVEWFQIFRKSKPAQEMLTGGLILALYTFILAPRLPFWISTSIFMIFIMGILNATAVWKNIVITAVVVMSIYVVFRMVFHVPLP
jgi:hypothetical protein